MKKEKIKYDGKIGIFINKVFLMFRFIKKLTNSYKKKHILDHLTNHELNIINDISFKN